MNIKGFFSNWIVRNLLLAIVFVAVLVTAVSLLLSVLTKHGKEITVPDFTNLTYAEAAKVASASGVQVVVSDSVYVKRLKPGAVYMQTPKAGEHVKKGRTIRLTTNTMTPKEVFMPSLVGCSLRQAKAELLRNGLVLGRLIYVRDIATNYVLRQQRYGRDIAPGTQVSSGTPINLVLGLNSDDELTYVPKLVGQQYMKAVDMLQENSLNVGRLSFDKTVKSYADSVSAVVYQQLPDQNSEALRKGSEVTLYLTTDKSRVPARTSK